MPSKFDWLTISNEGASITQSDANVFDQNKSFVNKIIEIKKMSEKSVKSVKLIIILQNSTKVPQEDENYIFLILLLEILTALQLFFQVFQTPFTIW